jgi:hypothetical protein
VRGSFRNKKPVIINNDGVYFSLPIKHGSTERGTFIGSLHKFSCKALLMVEEVSALTISESGAPPTSDRISNDRSPVVSLNFKTLNSTEASVPVTPTVKV